MDLRCPQSPDHHGICRHFPGRTPRHAFQSGHVSVPERDQWLPCAARSQDRGGHSVNVSLHSNTPPPIPATHPQKHAPVHFCPKPITTMRRINNARRCIHQACPGLRLSFYDLRITGRVLQGRGGAEFPGGVLTLTGPFRSSLARRMHEACTHAGVGHASMSQHEGAAFRFPPLVPCVPETSVWALPSLYSIWWIFVPQINSETRLHLYLTLIKWSSLRRPRSVS